MTLPGSSRDARPSTFPLPSITPEELQAVIAGERRAFERLVEKLRPWLLSIAGRLLQKQRLPPDLEEDLVQEVFVALAANRAHHLARWAQVSGHRDQLLGFIYVFARCRMIDYLRRTRRYVATADDALDALLAASLDEAEAAGLHSAHFELGEFLTRCVRPLCTQEEWHLLASAAEGTAARDLARQFHGTEASILQRLSRLRRRIREMVRTEEP